jgi:hypothetical protein
MAYSSFLLPCEASGKVKKKREFQLAEFAKDKQRKKFLRKLYWRKRTK